MNKAKRLLKLFREEYKFKCESCGNVVKHPYSVYKSPCPKCGGEMVRIE